MAAGVPDAAAPATALHLAGAVPLSSTGLPVAALINQPLPVHGPAAMGMTDAHQHQHQQQHHHHQQQQHQQNHLNQLNQTSDTVAATPSKQLQDAPQIRRRGAVACRRCRRVRSKCVHENRQPPCNACRDAGPVAESECTFPRRGDRDVDREFRRRQPRDSLTSNSIEPSTPGSPRTSVTSPLTAYRTESLSQWPHHSEVVEGCKVFVTSYFQLGFIPKAVFVENLAKDITYENHSRFLLAAILSISARFTPALVRRYGGAQNATVYFSRYAAQLVSTELYEPSLERTQAFFLLSVAEWGDGDKNRSSMHMGIAIRMALILKLHREETYHVQPDGTAEQSVRLESARRLFWMLHSQENLHSGNTTPAPFSLDDVTTLLPCSESDFAFGIIPAQRPALSGTQVAAANPQLVYLPDRSLFASLIQAHALWGRVARRATKQTQNLYGGPAPPPWQAGSEFQILTRDLQEWEDALPKRHQFSTWNLRGWKAEGLDLAFLAVTMVLRMSNIVVRRVYLDDITAALSGAQPVSAGGAPVDFWPTLSQQLFVNVFGLHEQIKACFSMRDTTESFPAILVFCVYICGSLSSYLRTRPQLCPHLAGEAESMATRSLEVLTELHHPWPTATRWQQGLRQSENSTGSAVSSVATIDNHTPYATLDDGSEGTPGTSVTARLPPSTVPGNFGDYLSNEFFDADLNAFLGHGLGLYDTWYYPQHGAGEG